MYDRGIAVAAEEEEAPSNVQSHGELPASRYELQRVAVEERILEATVGHELVDEEQAAAAVEGEAKQRDDAVTRVGDVGKGELLHGLDSDELTAMS